MVSSPDGGDTVFGLLNEGPTGTDLRGVIKKFITPMGDVLKNIDSVVNTNNTHISNLHDYINGIYYQNYSLNYCANDSTGSIDSHCSCWSVIFFINKLIYYNKWIELNF